MLDDLYVVDLLSKIPIRNEIDAQRRWGTPDSCCGIEGEPCSKPAKWRRQHTFYEDAKSNWVFACDDCFDDIQKYWAEQWSEYYSMIR